MSPYKALYKVDPIILPDYTVGSATVANVDELLKKREMKYASH